MAAGRIPTTANSPLTAKGDLFTYSTAPARLAVGTNGDSLVADSAATTGLRYSATPSASNPVLNSAMQIAQRGTTFTNSTSGAYTLDRWQVGVPAASSITRQATGDTTNLPFIQYCTRVQRPVSSTSTSDFAFIQNFESINSYQFAGKTVTFSFYARKGANYSAASNALAFRAQYSTSTVDGNAYFGPFAGAVDIVNTSVTLTTTWQRFTVSGAVGSTTTQIGFWFNETPVGTAGAADYYEVTGVQVDVGSVALPFRTYAATIQGELAACQRYFLKYGGNQTYETFPGVLLSYSTTQGEGPIALKSTMRTTPTVAFSTLKISDVATYNIAVTNLTITTNSSGPDSAYLVFTVASGATSGKTNLLRTDGSTAGYLTFSAEL